MRGLVVSAEWKPKDGYRLTGEEERTGRVRLANQVLYRPAVALGERPDPSLHGDHDVLIRSVASGICGSDLHMVTADADGYMDIPAPYRVPVALGHENSGIVVEVGAAVTRVRPGDLVAVEAQVECGRCRACLRGLRAACANMWDRGFSLDGGTATMTVAHERHCWSLAALVDRFGEQKASDIGALVEPASVAYNGIVNRAGGFRAGDSVAVFGAGPIGLAAVALAGALGAGRVLAIDPAPAKRNIASTLGATDVHDPATGATGEWIHEVTGGAGIDMAIDATGVGRRVIPQIVESIGVGGKIVSLGANGAPVEVDTIQLMFRAASMHFTVGHLGGGFAAVIALHAAGRIDLSSMITARFSLDDGVAAIEQAERGQDAKILIYPHTDDYDKAVAQ